MALTKNVSQIRSARLNVPL